VAARGIHGQENVSAKQRPAQEKAWIPRSDEDRERAPGAETQARQGSKEIDRIEESRSERFTRLDRLHRRREFEAVYSRGFRVPGRYFVLFILPNQAGRSRLGVTLSRKVGNAVVRNQARRRLREVFRKCQDARQACLDIVIHCRPEIARKPQSELRAAFLDGLRRYATRKGARP